MKIRTKSDFFVRWIVHPKKPHLRYIQVMDKVSMSVHLLVMVRKIKAFGFTSEVHPCIVLDFEDLKRLFSLRMSTEYQDGKTYELSEVCP